MVVYKTVGIAHKTAIDSLVYVFWPKNHKRRGLKSPLKKLIFNFIAND